MKHVISLVIALAIHTDPLRAADLTVVLQDGFGGYNGTKDAQLLKDYNLGGWTQFGISDFDEPALIKFDLSQIPSSARVHSATLELSFLSCGFSPEEIKRSWPVEVFQCDHEWIEGTGTDAARTQDGAKLATFNGKDAWPGGKVAVLPDRRLGRAVIAGGQDQRWYKWTLDAALVQKWISGERDNFGMVVFGKPPGKHLAFVAHENAMTDRRPILRLGLSVPDSEVSKLATLSLSDATWQQFLKDCGLKAQEINEARTEKAFREKYRDKVVAWSGTVHSVAEQKLGRGFELKITMNPTESRLGASDISIGVPEAFKETALALNKGDKVKFTARITKQGGNFLDHQLELLTLTK